MNSKKKRMLTGTRPSGSPHLGNYFGAFNKIITNQYDYEFYFFLADLHALNGHPCAELMEKQSLDMVATLLACGLDPSRGLFYAQSAVPQVTELAWILGCQAPYGMLTRAHSFKDAQAKGSEVNMGVFSYPILMAADILMFDADLVPVGQDQKQHIEMTRDFAQRFNHRYGPIFILPEPIIEESVAVIPGTDGEKMSKSKDNVVSIFASDKEWKRQVMSIVTAPTSLEEPKDPSSCAVFALYKAIAMPEETEALAAKYRGGNYGYGHAKIELLSKIKDTFGPMRDRYQNLIQKPDDLRDVIATGSSQARQRADQKMVQVKTSLGLLGRVP